MGAGTNLFVVRISIFLGMGAAVVTLLYLAPVPDQSFGNCDRPCLELGWPMICRFNFVIEKLPTSVICQDCQNNTNCSFCSLPNDISQNIITVNRQFPAPRIHVCQNDIIIANVVNKLQGQSLTMHWRGQNNAESPFMDGVPLITQCPIGPYTTFQYRFRASSAGTHSYNAFSDVERSNGLFGALIVRKPEQLEENLDNYDVDDNDHVLVLSESNDKFLINGVGPSNAPLSTFLVKEGKRYLFRVIYASGTGCSLTLTVDNHLVTVVAVDGNPVKPIEVSSVKLSKGETLDFVIKANQVQSSYFINVRSMCNSRNLNGRALITYEGSTEETTLRSLDLVKDWTKFDTSDCKAKSGETCFKDIENIQEMDERLKRVDMRIFLGLDSIKNRNELEEKSLNYPKDSYRTNNISFIFPPSPLLTQPTDVPADLMCNESYLPDRCREKEKCDCVHLQHIPLGSSVEIVFIDQGFWILRDENAQGWTRGLDMVFQVGDTGDLVEFPSAFPVCGNFIGPDFFLL